MRTVLTIIIITLFKPVIYGQVNKITIKKKTEVTEEDPLTGFYYSHSMVQEFKGSSGMTSYKQIRYYLYISGSKKIYIFTSPLSPQKARKKFSKKREDIADEIGKYSTTENSLYLTTNTTDNRHRATYRYVGEIGDEFLYLSYKAAYKQKVALDIYLYKFE